MTAKLYLQPLGFLRGALARSAEAAGQARRLAGLDLSFTQLRLIRRAGPREVTEQIVPVGAFADHMAAYPVEQKTQIKDLFAHLIRPRPPLCLPDGTRLDLQTPRIQGILNVTPDSFSDGGRFDKAAAALRHARFMHQAGADFIDIGGESTRPGAEPVSLEEELGRVIPLVEELAGEGIPLSVDTRNAPVMAQALEKGAHIINDVSALTHDRDSLSVVAASTAPVILMHAQGSPQTMQQDPRYDDVVLDVFDYLEERIACCLEAGISRDRLIADPGIGFGKTVEHNLALLRHISLFHGLGVPLLLGASRKSFIGALSGAQTATDRLPGSLATAQAFWDQGGQIVRVHDVAQTRQALTIWSHIHII
tara:strand:- start:2032 stop:3126 length:1095 start_codon:yes stop_codon:yes gene_type:complete